MYVHVKCKINKWIIHQWLILITLASKIFTLKELYTRILEDNCFSIKIYFVGFYLGISIYNL